MGICYCLIDCVCVQLLCVDLDVWKMDFCLIQEFLIKVLCLVKVIGALEVVIMCQFVGVMLVLLVGCKKLCQLVVLLGGMVKLEEFFDEMFDCVIEEQLVFELGGCVVFLGYVYVKLVCKKQLV